MENGETKKEDAPVVISKSRWFNGALAIAVLNPIFAGLLMGILLWRTQGMQKEGKIVTAFSIIWGGIILLLAYKYGAFKQF